jgi:hypothetical protein
MAFHYVFNDYSGVELHVNYQKYTFKVLGATLLLVKLSSLIKIYLKTIFRVGAANCPPCTPLKKPDRQRYSSCLASFSLLGRLKRSMTQ